MCPPMLFQANKKGEILLHLAARYGHSSVVKVLIDRAEARPTDPESGVTEAKKMLRMTNVEQDTALHVAARNRRSHVVEILTKEDPEFPYSAMFMEKLHFILLLPVWVKNEKSSRIVRVLLEYDASAAYIAETEKKRTALHIAAIRGLVDVMKEIVSRCPACCELVDNRGWNALHYTVASKDTKVFEECLEIPLLARLKNEKDDNGNTLFHLIAALAREQKQWQRVLFNDSYSDRDIYGLNKRKLSVNNIYEGKFGEIEKKILESLEDVGSGPINRGPFVLKGEEEKNNDEENKEEEEALSKARESHLVVAALIATVTFAAAFTLPGGYKSDRGTAILAKKAAFIVFVISDAISMVLSIFAVFIHFLISLIHGFELVKSEDINEDVAINLFGVATLLTMIGMGTMIIAFITGTYAVLEPSLGLAIGTCLIGLSFFFLVYLVFRIICKNLKD
eukprot:XP_024449125.1 ankyrin repeat-containing protein At5g02620 [Populus trichocarpa]